MHERRPALLLEPGGPAAELRGGGQHCLAGTPVSLTLAPGAGESFADFQRWLELQLSPEDGMADACRPWAGKLAGAVLRIAGGFHCVAHATQKAA